MDILSAQVIQTLRRAFRALGLTTGSVERQLGMSTGYLSRIFAGKIELKLRHIEEIAKILGLEPAELLSLSFPPEPDKRLSPAARRVREALGLEPAELKAPSSREPAESETEEMMLRTLRRVLGLSTPSRSKEEEMEEMVVRALRRLVFEEGGTQRQGR
ncbi:MAG TPA: helix-turn-helix transcriptional regulator [Thermoanaerobaculia bacterium]|nr:helix-turn-helix transcriptional regulator [Thermoanaerobaculia bacterium]